MHCTKMETKKKVYGSLILLLVVSIIKLVSASTTINDTIFFSSTSNSTVYVNATFDALNNTDNWLEVYNISGYGNYFSNLNTTYSGVIHLYNLNNALIVYSNNSIAGNSDISLNDGNINFTISPSNSSRVFMNYIFNESASDNGPLSIVSKSNTGNYVTYEINSSLDTDIITDFIPSSVSCPTSITSGARLEFTCDSSQVSLVNSIRIKKGSTTLEVYYASTTQPSTNSESGGSNPARRIITETVTDNSSTLNPKTIQLIFPEFWEIGTQVQVRVKSFNQSNDLYYPKEVTFETDDEITLQKTEKSQDEVVGTFLVSGLAKKERKLMKITVTDERTLSHIINFTVEDENDNKYEKITNRKNLLYILAGAAIVILAVLVYLKIRIKRRHFVWRENRLKSFLARISHSHFSKN